MWYWGAFIIVLAAGLFLWGIGWAVGGYWPLRFGEPFDLIAFSIGTVWIGWMLCLRGQRHQRGVLLGNPEELQHFGSPEQRQAAVDAVLKELREARESRRAFTIVVAILSAVVTVPTYLVVRWVASEYLPVTPAKLIAWLCAAAILLLPTYVGIRRGAPRLLRRRLREQDIPICMDCGYVLIGCPGPKCPECGIPFDDETKRLIAPK